MSVWTHIAGSIELAAPCYKKTKKKIVIKDEWIKVLGFDTDRLDFAINNLPIHKDYIDELIKTYLPQGEDRLCYFLNQDETSYDSVDYDLTKNLSRSEKRYLKSFMGSMPEKYCKTRNSHFTLTIRDDIRYCGGMDMLASLEEMFLKIFEDDILGFPQKGCLEWYDECDDDYYKMTTNFDEVVFYMCDGTTGMYKGKKVYERVWNKDTHTSSFKLTHDSITRLNNGDNNE